MARRFLLIALAVVALGALMYASVATALSVPVTGEMDRANRAPGSPPLAGTRALLVPIPDPTRVEGDLLVAGETPSGFPSGARNATMGRVLAYVAPTANGSYVPASRVVENGTVDVAVLAAGRSGFLVKGDAAPDVWFVETGDALGSVARFETWASLVALYSFGSIGFVAPLVLLIVTHRATGRPGVPAEVAGCPECRAPVAAGQEFCYKCGAVLGKRS